MLPNFLLAVLVLLAFLMVARLFRRWVTNLAQKLSKSPSLAGLFGTMAYMIILLTGLSFALSILQLDKAVNSILAGAGILGLVVGFAFQDLSSNFISGIFITFKKPFDVGDTVETNGYLGKVEAIELRSTTIRTFQGLHVMIPNKEIFMKPMINYSLTPERRIELEFDVPANADLGLTEEKIKAVLEQVPQLGKEKGKEPKVYFTAMAGTAVKATVWTWIKTHQDVSYMATRHEIISKVMQILRNPPQQPSQQ